MWILLCLILYLTQNTDSSLRFQEVSRQRRLVSWIPKYARNPPSKYEKKIKYKTKSKYAFSGHNTINQIQTQQQLKSHHNFPKHRNKTITEPQKHRNRIDNKPQKSHHKERDRNKKKPQKSHQKHRDRIDDESPKSHHKDHKRRGRTANSNKPPKHHDNLKDGNDEANRTECSGGVVPYPVHLPNGWFYQRLCTTQNGLMVVSSNAVKEEALEKTAFIIRRMTKYVNKKVIRQMKRAEFRQAVMGMKEMTYDIPEHSWLKKAYPDGRYAGNRGIGATSSHPVGSNAEENVLCYSNDTYWDEDITIHEFAHSIHLLGFKPTFTNFEKRLKRLYKNAKRRELWSRYYWHQHVYAMKNYQEYFAVGVQSYFGRAARHNAPKKRSGLKRLDPKLFRYAGNRGIGATSSHPVGSNAEENVLCYSNDTYWDEDITIHEFAHSIHLLGFKPTFTNFEKRLKRLYKNAKRRELWSQYYWHQHVYAMKNYQEYFAVGVQSYFGRAARHNAPKKRSGLKRLDPKLFRFIDKYFGRNPWRGKECHCASSNHLECKLQN